MQRKQTEEQYYIFFPLLLAGIWGRNGRHAVPVIAWMLGLSFLLALYLVHAAPSAAFYLLPTRAWELLVGSLAALAFATDRAPVTSLATRQGLSALGLAMIGYAVLAFDDTTPFPGAPALVPTIGAVLVLLFARPGTLAQRLLSRKAPLAIGLISYSAYLWHQPIFAFVRYDSLHHPSGIVMLALCGVSFGLAWLSWRHIERPFRAKGVLGRGTIFTLSLSSLALFCALGIAGSLLNGWPSRLSPEERALIASVQVSPKRSLCNVSPDNALEPEDACVFNGDVPQVAVFGDSHTVELAYALGALARDRNIAVAQYSRAACNPAYGKTDDDPCTAWTHDAVETILAADTITDVVISYRMAAALYGATNEAYPDFVDDRTEEDRSATWAAFLDVLDAFRAGGKRVYFVIQVPELHRDVQHLVSAAAGQPAEDALPGVTRDWWDRRIGDVMDRLHELPAGVTVIDPTGFFCDRTRCYATRDGRALYFDDDHMSVYGAKLVARPVLAAILRHVSGP